MPGITITLTGTTSAGQSVTYTTTTGTDGSYSFSNLAPGTYAVSEDTTQLPTYYMSQAVAGTENPGNTTVDGTAQTSAIIAINLVAGDNGVNYDFDNFFFIPAA
jgi:hypothetical protein